MIINSILLYILGKCMIAATSDTEVETTPGWTLVMKIARGQDIGGAESVHDLWTGTYTVNEGKEEAMSLSTGSTTYKSSIVDNWDDYNMIAVRVSFATHGLEKAYIVFDAHGSNKTSWFNKSRILYSSWNDLNPQSTTNYDSIDGTNFHARRFYMNRANGGCHGDNGWFTVLDLPDYEYCDWERRHSKPCFLYSDEPGYEESYKQAVADVFAIWVSVNPNPSKAVSRTCQNKVVNMTSEELVEVINALKMELKIDRRKTSMNIRRKTSANDQRTSARVLGAVGAVMLATPFVLIALSDLSNFYRYFNTKVSQV